MTVYTEEWQAKCKEMARLATQRDELLAACQHAADLIDIYQARGSASDRHALNIAAKDCRAAISRATP